MAEPRLPANFPLPERTEYPGHQCRCELVREIEDEDGRPTGRTVHDACAMKVWDPESPICDPCVQSGHDDLPRYTLREIE